MFESPLLYEELKRLHEERVARSLRRKLALEARRQPEPGQPNLTLIVREAEVIELPTRERTERMGA